MPYKKTVDELTGILGAQGVQAIRQHLGAIWNELPFLSEEQFRKTLNTFEKHFSPIVEQVVDEDRWFQEYSRHALESMPPDTQRLEAPPLQSPKAEPAPLKPDAAARLKLIEQPGSEEFNRWMGGDKAIIEERDKYYAEQFPGKQEIL